MGAEVIRARIHRGAQAIGGSCVDLEHDGARLVIDLGLPLDADLDAPPPIPPIPGLTQEGGDLLGVIISHNHPDHDGLVEHVDPRIPVFAGLAGRRMDLAASRFIGGEREPRPALELRDGVPVRLDPFCVTPLLVDHSAFEAFALLVEAGGRRLLYSGDLRAHGRKPRTWQRLLNEPPPGIHALLLEGTRLSRPSETNISEQDVEDELTALANATPGLLLACYSGQNIDRLVSVYKAARRAGRVLILDLYGAAIAAATGRATIPQAGWAGVRVFVPHAQRGRLIAQRAFADIDAVARCRIFPEQLGALAPRAIVTMRGSMTRQIEDADCLADAAAVWSMWPGYLEQPSGSRFRSWLEDNEVPLHVIHASGHASVADLQALAAAIAADQVVPIHTTTPHRYAELFDRVTIRKDGEWWTI